MNWMRAKILRVWPKALRELVVKQLEQDVEEINRVVEDIPGSYIEAWELDTGVSENPGDGIRGRRA